jgi:MFS transporter, DHA1 family, tetracycline resistance protein
MDGDGGERAPPAGAPAGGDAPAVPMGAFATIWLTLFLDLLGFGIVIPVLPYYASEHGASPAVVTLLSTSFSLAQFAMSPVLGRLSDRHGRRPVMLLSIAGSCVSMLVLGFASTLWMVFLARVVSGTCNANVSTANAYIADRVAPRERARYMGMMGSAIGMGFVFGPAIGGLLSSPSHPELPFLCAAGLAAVNWLMAWKWLPESLPRGVVAAPRAGGSSPLRAIGRLLDVRGTPLAALVWLTFGFFFAFSAMESTMALLTEVRLGWDARHTGYMFSMIGACIVLSQTVVLGRLVRRFGEKNTLVIGLVVQAVGLAGCATAFSVVQMVAFAGLIALGNGLVTPSTSAIVSRLSSADEQGLNLGLVQSAAALSRIFGPAAAGLMFEHISPGAPMGVAAVVVIGVVLLVAPRIQIER